MTAKSDLVRLPDAAEALLADWPEVERAALDWEQQVEQTMAKIREIDVGTTDDALLAPPLPAEPDEPAQGAASQVSVEAEDPSDLSEIARRALSGPAPAPDMDALVRETLSHAAQARRPVVLAKARKVRRGAADGAAALQANQAEPASPLPRDSGRVTSRSSAAPSSARQRRERAWIAYSGVATLLAAAAVTVLFVKTRDHQVEMTAAAPAQSPAMPAAAPAREEATPLAQPGQPEPAISLEALQEEASPAGSPPAPKEMAKAKPAQRTAPLAERSAAPAPGSTETTNTGLGAVARGKGVADDPPLKPAAEDTSLRQKPNQGDISAAFASALPAARRCVAGAEEGSTVTATFGSDGRVNHVSVTGPAAGTPAGACLESAFKSARVAPFAATSFTASMTVRPP